MKPDDPGQEQDRKGSSQKPKHQHERWQDPSSAAQVRSWTNKTMHHPATRIGEIRPGK